MRRVIANSLSRSPKRSAAGVFVAWEAEERGDFLGIGLERAAFFGVALERADFLGIDLERADFLGIVVT
jgi:uncharacterized protein YjbI with pentapeptide repeats